MPDKPVMMFGEFNEDDPRFQVRLLAQRIDRMEKEHEEEVKEYQQVKEELAKFNQTYQRGLGVAAAILAFGAFIGFLFANGKVIFAPWSKP